MKQIHLKELSFDTVFLYAAQGGSKFKVFDKSLMRVYSNVTYRAVLSCGTVDLTLYNVVLQTVY